MTTPETTLLPAWKAALAALTSEDAIHYGMERPAAWFATVMRMKEDTRKFRFEMMRLKEVIERDLGYYLEQDENGAVWRIPTPAGHVDVCHALDRRVLRSACRALAFGTKTLANPESDLDAEARRALDSANEKRAFRLVMLERQAHFERLHQAQPLAVADAK